MANKSGEHWEQIHRLKKPHEVSWTEEVPLISLEFIHRTGTDKKASLIDVGGGDSKLAGCLLLEGFVNLTVLDISATAIRKARAALGGNADLVNWISSDILDFRPSENFDLWHDRAAFHFLTDPETIRLYLQKIEQYVNRDVILGTFSKEGPDTCSGLPVKQYDEAGMRDLFSDYSFDLAECKRAGHITPSGQYQDFIFARFRRKNT